MKRTALLFYLLSVLLAVPAVAQSSTAATRSDLRQLQAEVERLDDSLANLRSDNPQTHEFQRRADAIRDDLTRIREVMRTENGEDRASMGASKEDVDSVREATIELRRDVDRVTGNSSSYGRRTGRDGAIPDGTEISVRLEESLSSRTARPEDRIDATVAQAVRVDGMVAIPAGATVSGVVQNVEAARRPARGGRLELSFDQIIVDGRRMDIRSRVVDLSESRVDKSKVGLGAVLGGVLGAVLDGGKGAILGAIVGGGGAVVGTKGDEVELPAGTVVTLRLEQPVPVARR
jgi:hypothetical protein